MQGGTNALTIYRRVNSAKLLPHIVTHGAHCAPHSDW